MKLAVLGGSFNPLHIGHCMLAETAVSELGYDKVLFVPLFIPPHKVMNDAASAQDRLAMIKAFCKSCCSAGYDFFEAEDYEIKKGGISYTFNTLEYLIKKYNLQDKPGLIIGKESAGQFGKWYNSAGIASMADLILASRMQDLKESDSALFKNSPSEGYNEDFSHLHTEFNYPHKILKNPIIPVSSTQIRSRIALHKAWRYLVPYEVFHYIIEHKLYGA